MVILYLLDVKIIYYVLISVDVTVFSPSLAPNGLKSDHAPLMPKGGGNAARKQWRMINPSYVSLSCLN